MIARAWACIGGNIGKTAATRRSRPDEVMRQDIFLPRGNRKDLAEAAACHASIGAVIPYDFGFYPLLAGCDLCPAACEYVRARGGGVYMGFSLRYARRRAPVSPPAANRDTAGGCCRPPPSYVR